MGHTDAYGGHFPKSRTSLYAVEEKYDRIPNVDEIEKRLKEAPDITHAAVVHCETTSGILNDIYAIAKVVKKAGKTLIVDAMSSFGGIEIPVEDMGIDFLISSANKCIQGVPGFSFIIARREALEQCAGKARSLSLDLYGQWTEMEKDGKWRFTSPTQWCWPLHRLCESWSREGGIEARQKRYAENNRLLIEGMKLLGFQTYIAPEVQSHIITTFLYPENTAFSFPDLYHFIKERGYAIYPGKLTDAETFRIRQYWRNLSGGHREAFDNFQGVYEAAGGTSMSIRIEAVIFDWAGTVVDYGCFAPVEAFRQAFEEAGIHPAVEEIRKPMGLSKRLHVQTRLEMPRITGSLAGSAWPSLDGRRR